MAVDIKSWYVTGTAYVITHVVPYVVLLLLLLIIIIIRAFVRRTMSASELNLRRRQSLGGEDG